MPKMPGASRTCELEFEGCAKLTPVMFGVQNLLATRTPARSTLKMACSECWKALTARNPHHGMREAEKAWKNQPRLPKIPTRESEPLRELPKMERPVGEWL